MMAGAPARETKLLKSALICNTPVIYLGHRPVKIIKNEDCEIFGKYVALQREISKDHIVFIVGHCFSVGIR